MLRPLFVEEVTQNVRNIQVADVNKEMTTNEGFINSDTTDVSTRAAVAKELLILMSWKSM